MQKRNLGQSGLAVSAIGLGTVKFGRNQGVKYPQAFALPSDAEIKNLLALAKELGINLLDTAPAYGSSEERLGKLLQGSRNDWIISSKAGETFHDGVSHYDFSSHAIIRSVENSLKQLRTDNIDILLVHSNGEDERIIREDNVFETLATLKSQGKIRAYGMSTKTIAGGLLTIDHADVAMVTYNPTATEDKEIILHAEKNKKGILIKKAFSSGHLQMPVKELMQFIFQEPGVSSVIVGTIQPEHFRQNVESAMQVLDCN